MDDWLHLDVEENFMYTMRCNSAWIIVEAYISTIKVNHPCQKGENRSQAKVHMQNILES